MNLGEQEKSSAWHRIDLHLSNEPLRFDEAEEDIESFDGEG